MLERMLNTPSMAYLRKGLDAAWLRNEVIANNLANVDTPNFTSSSVEFEEIFKKALHDSDFTYRTTRPEHIQFNPDWEHLQPRVLENPNTDIRMDGNNVDVDVEMLELSRNTLHYNTMVQKLSSEFNRLRTAITG